MNKRDDAIARSAAVLSAAVVFFMFHWTFDDYAWVWHDSVVIIPILLALACFGRSIVIAIGPDNSVGSLETQVASLETTDPPLNWQRHVRGTASNWLARGIIAFVGGVTLSVAQSVLEQLKVI